MNPGIDLVIIHLRARGRDRDRTSAAGPEDRLSSGGSRQSAHSRRRFHQIPIARCDDVQREASAGDGFHKTDVGRPGIESRVCGKGDRLAESLGTG